jgi:hypothetical protein
VPPTDTPVPPTDTPVPPTDTPVPPTDTPIPPTDTPEGPTDTPEPPTDTPVPPTDTPIPPTDTPEPPTDTPVPPTDTPIPPTDTPVPPTDTPAPTNTPGAGDLPFFDDFEDADMSDWTIVGHAVIRNDLCYAGTYCAGAKQGGTFEQTISTAGSTNVHVKYAGATKGNLDAGESLKVEWYDGSSWTLLDEIVSEGTFVYRDWDMPAGADDNASFAVRFTANCDHTIEWVYVDNVEVTGE